MNKQTLATLIEKLQAEVSRAIESDEADADKLSDADNSYNEGWRNGVSHAIDVLKTVA